MRWGEREEENTTFTCVFFISHVKICNFLWLLRFVVAPFEFFAVVVVVVGANVAFVVRYAFVRI